MIKARHFTASLAGLTALLSACTMMPQADSALAGEAAFAEADGAFHSQAGDMGDFLIARYASLTNDPEAAADRYDLAPLAAKEKPIRHVLSNGFGFGGVNAALVFSKSP